MINLAASLQAGTAQPAPAIPSRSRPTAGFTLLGGLTGSPGSTVGHGRGGGAPSIRFSRLRPSSASQSINTVKSVRYRATAPSYPTASAGDRLRHYAERGLTQRSRSTADPDAARRGPRKHRSEPRAGASARRHQHMNLLRIGILGGSITLNYADLLTGLSQAFRPDLSAARP